MVKSGKMIQVSEHIKVQEGEHKRNRPGVRIGEGT